MKQERKNHKNAWVYFQSIGSIPLYYHKNEWCLHHKDPELKYKDRTRYDEWRIEDLIPMRTTDHIKLHSKIDPEKIARMAKERANDPEVIQKIKESWTPERRVAASERMRRQNNEWATDEELIAKRVQKRRATMSVKLSDEEYRREYHLNISNSLNDFYSSDASEDTRLTLSEKTKERWADPEYKKRVSENMRRALSDPYVIARRSEITKDRIWINDETIDRRIKSSDPIPEGFTLGRCRGDCSKTVLQFDIDGNFIKEYESQYEAAKSLGLKTQGNLSTAIKNQTPYHGYIWKFAINNGN